MRKILLFLLSSLLVVTVSFGQNETLPAMDTAVISSQAAQESKQSVKKQKQKRVYFGGNVAFNFGSYTRIGIYPLIGFKITPKFSLGLKIGYEYVKDNRYSPSYETSNYGGSVFARYRIIPRLYVHAEYELTNYDIWDGAESNREWVNFLLLGAGYSQPIGGNAYVNAQVLFDVLQSENSPYQPWEPIFSVGVGVGF
ncbi:MAG: hypothetical protein QNK30_06445 [Bacteroidales bacterium]|nr:hypothetical protein [Bacteroidales bacterium]